MESAADIAGKLLAALMALVLLAACPARAEHVTYAAHEMAQI